MRKSPREGSGGRVKVHFNTAISRLCPQDAHWQLFDQNNQLKLESEIVVLANAAHYNGLGNSNKRK